MRISPRLCSLGVALALAALCLLTGDRAIVARPASLTLVYVSAKNCAPCEAWHRTEEAAFRATPQFGRLDYREVKSPSLSDVLKDENWPEDLGAYRSAIDRHAGVPLWLVVADGRVVFQSSGLSQWREAVLPKLTRLVQ